MTEQPEMTTEGKPVDGHILLAEAYPRGEESLTFSLLYSESGGSIYEGRQFQIEKDVAEALAKRILQILAEPDTQTAWENIAKDVDEEDHDL